MEKIHENVHAFVHFKHESTKHACFHVNFPFSAYCYPHYIIMVKGLLGLTLLL